VKEQPATAEVTTESTENPQPPKQEKMTLQDLSEGLQHATYHVAQADELRKELEEDRKKSRKLVKRVLQWSNMNAEKIDEVPPEMRQAVTDLFKKGWKGLLEELQRSREVFEVIDLDVLPPPEDKEEIAF